MAGRSFRLWPGKEDALILDLVGVARVLKLVTLANLDAGTSSRVVDTEGNDIPPEDDDLLPQPALGVTRKQRSIRQGPIDTIEIDLLSADETDVLWLGTRKGVPFIQPQGEDWCVFLWATGEDLFKVGTMTTRGRKEGGWLDDGRTWPLAVAKEMAEDYLLERGVQATSRLASWRRTQAPSAAQCGFAATLGIDNPDSYTKAALSDQISIAIVSPRLDGTR
jgi:hypothetical protein